MQARRQLPGSRHVPAVGTATRRARSPRTACHRAAARRVLSGRCMRVVKALLPLAFVAALATRAHADHHPSLEYVFDDGAVPLFWIPVVSGAVIDAEVSPRATPLGFDAGEAGATPPSWQVPGWAIAAAGAWSVVLIATSDD